MGADQTNGEPEPVATALRLLLAHLTVQSDRLNMAMVLDRLVVWDRAAAYEAAGHGSRQGAANDGSTSAEK